MIDQKHDMGGKHDPNRPVENEPAFPTPYHPKQEWENPQGMTLRDYFAAKAMAHIPALIDASDENPSYQNIVRHAYNVADAMLKARKESV